MRRAFDFDLDGFEKIVPAIPIQAKKAGRTRALTEMESLSLALGALGTLGQTRGVKIANAFWNGRQVAIAVIESARFGADEKGISLLSNVIAGEEIKERV